ncbi:unnamed protein product [Symbiodinium microadriaticum]|nr:unnamed protein product [Symbiodinium microadriaticum]
MRTLFGKKKDKDSSENFSSVSTPSLPPAAPAEEGCSDLAFLPSRPGGDWPPTLADRRRPVDTEDIPLPGRKSKLAGLFDEDVALEAPKSEHLEVKVPAAAPSVPGPSPATMGDAKIAWSGLTRLFRLDDAGDEMMEVEAGEGRDGLFVAVLRSSADVGHQLELLVYTAIRKRKRLRVAAAVLELQTPSQDSVSFYDDTGIYWALQLEKTEESVPLARLLLAAKAASSGEVAMVELKCADTEAAPCSLRLAAVSHRSLLQSETQATVPSTSSLPREQLESADAWWGSGASRALEGQLAGSVALLAVPPGSQGSLRSSDDSVLLLEVVAEGLAEVDRPVEINQDTKRLSVKERMAKLAAASLPPGAIGMMPLAEGDVDEKVSSSGRPKEAKDPVLPGPGVCPSPPRPSHPGPLPVNQSGLQNGHPSAEIIRQYWSAVQESGTAPYAYLGALPFVPGLTRMPIAPSALHSTHGAAAIAEMAKGFNAGPVPPSMPTGPTGPALTLEVPLSSVSMGEFMASMRDLVRAEATPEGWQAERQKLERRVSLLEEQLRSSKVHQDQLRDAMRTQHSQLADAQQQLREQLRMDGERQMREWELDAAKRAAEAELRNASAEAHQLRLEQRSMQEQLAMALESQQRAECSAAAAAGSAASLSAAEARLADQNSMVTTLRQQLAILAAARASEAIAVSRGVLAVAYVGVSSSLPTNPGALVAVEGLSQRLRAACRQCGRVLEQQLQSAHEISWTESGPSPLDIDWEAVEAKTLQELGSTALPDLGSAPMKAAPAAEKLLQDEVKQQSMELDRLRAEVRSCQQQIHTERNVSNDLREQLQTQQAGDAELLLLREQLAAERERREALENSKAHLVTSPAENDTPLLISRQVSDASDVHQMAPEVPAAESNQPCTVQQGTPEPEQPKQPEASGLGPTLEATEPPSGRGMDEQTAEQDGKPTQLESNAHEQEPPAALPGVEGAAGSQGEDELRHIEQSAEEPQRPQLQQENWPSRDQEQKRSAQATASRKTLPDKPEASGCPPCHKIAASADVTGSVHFEPDRHTASRYP